MRLSDEEWRRGVGRCKGAAVQKDKRAQDL